MTTPLKSLGRSLWTENKAWWSVMRTPQQNSPAKAFCTPSSEAFGVMQKVLTEVDQALCQKGINYFIIGSCARSAYMSRIPHQISDVDIIIPDVQHLDSVSDDLKHIGERYGLFIDTSLSRVFEQRSEQYCLTYGPLSYPIPSTIMQTRRVRWGSAKFSTLPAQTLLHTFGLVAEPLREKDRLSALQFARSLKYKHEFDNSLFRVFHLFWRAHWQYFPLKPIQYWWRQRIKRMPRMMRFCLLRKLYPCYPVRKFRSVLNILETRICLAPRDMPERMNIEQKTRIAKQNKGFSLVEILAVLLIIGILAALIYPVISKAREKGRRASCAATLHQFGLAFSMYAQDFDGRLPNPGGRGMQGSAQSPAVAMAQNGAVWCSFGTNNKGLFTYVTRQTAEANNHWTCPNSLPDAPSWKDTQYNVGQTYSMNDYLRAMHPGQSVTAEGDVPNNFNPGFHTGIKIDAIGANASQLILLFEAVEHPRGGAKRNGSPYFGVYPSRYPVYDLPRNVPEEYHSGGSNFLFCDGHVKWLNPTVTWTPNTQNMLEKLNYYYAHARGGRIGKGDVDMWNPQIKEVTYP